MTPLDDAVAKLEAELDAIRYELDQIPRRRSDVVFSADAEQKIAALREREQNLYDAVEVGEGRLERLRERLNGMALRPARAALAAHLATVANAQADLERASRPVERLSAELRVANEQYTAAEANLAEINAKHAASLRERAESDGAIKLGKLPESEAAEVVLASGRRICNVVRTALAECEAKYGDVASTLRDLTAQLDPLMLAVFEEEFARSLELREEARLVFVAADLDAVALKEVLHRHGLAPYGQIDNNMVWVAAGRRAGATYGKQLPPEWSPRDLNNALARWKGVLARLSSDPSARG